MKILWVSHEAPFLGGAARELLLPSGTVQLVFRLAHPLRVFDGASDPHGRVIAHALIGGVRAVAHIRDISQPSISVGAQLLPGAVPALMGVPAHLLSGRHTALADVWGAEVERIREQLLELSDPAAQLDRLETLLVARLAHALPTSPVIAPALAQLARGARVREVADACGYSHKHFIQLFERAVGLPPKLYTRVVRLAGALPHLRADASLARAALRAGYSDQAHFSRDFREISGLSPSDYLRLGPQRGHHVPLAFGGDATGKIHSRR